jgi:hypothetical protein
VAFKIFLGAALLIGAFLILGAVGSRTSSEADYAAAECEKMMSDSAPGAERRRTREVCDAVKARIAGRQ